MGFVAWIAAAGLFFVVHLLIAIDYRRASDVEWVKGVPAYAWLLGTGLSFVSTILIVAALLPVLDGGFLGSTFTGGAIGKLLVAPNVMLSGYVSSLQLGRAAIAARRSWSSSHRSTCCNKRPGHCRWSPIRSDDRLCPEDVFAHVYWVSPNRRRPIEGSDCSDYQDTDDELEVSSLRIIIQSLPKVLSFR